MRPPRRSLRSICVITSCLAAATLVACAQSDPADPTGSAGGSSSGDAGATGTGGNGAGAGTSGAGDAGTTGTTGTAGRGGTTGSAGTTGTAGSAGTTGAAGRGGATGSAGSTGAGGRGGSIGLGGSTGAAGRGGATGTGGTTGTAGTTGTGGTTGSGGAAAVDCSATIPTSGGTMHSGTSQGTAGTLSWSLWENGSGGSITTYTSTPAFSAAWGPNSGDFLARIGLQWGNGKAVSALGTVAAQYTETKSGSGGGYSYLGIYGWSTNPCIEWYIVDDSYNKMPVNPGNTTNKGMVTIDGGSYILYTRPTSGTGGSRCSGVSSWTQFYSVRTTARTCGQITISDHFAAWANAGMTLGSVLEASILVEVGGGTGSIDFPTATVTAM